MESVTLVACFVESQPVHTTSPGSLICMWLLDRVTIVSQNSRSKYGFFGGVLFVCVFPLDFYFPLYEDVDFLGRSF